MKYMKKLLILLPLTLMALTGCNSNKVDNRVSDTPRETVTLRKENFSTYVACNSSVTFNNIHRIITLIISHILLMLITASSLIAQLLMAMLIWQMNILALEKLFL